MFVCEMFGLQLFTSDTTRICDRNKGKHLHKKVLTGKSGIEELKLYPVLGVFYDVDGTVHTFTDARTSSGKEQQLPDHLIIALMILII